jgi:hypothetical protein
MEAKKHKIKICKVYNTYSEYDEFGECESMKLELNSLTDWDVVTDEELKTLKKWAQIYNGGYEDHELTKKLSCQSPPQTGKILIIEWGIITPKQAIKYYTEMGERALEAKEKRAKIREEKQKLKEEKIKKEKEKKEKQQLAELKKKYEKK